MQIYNWHFGQFNNESGLVIPFKKFERIWNYLLTDRRENRISDKCNFKTIEDWYSQIIEVFEKQMAH